VSTSVGSTTTFFVGAHYEVAGSSVTKYYFAGSQRIAMRKDTTLYYLLSDHLGSTSIVTDAAGTVVSQTRYKAWGEVRYSSGGEVTKYQFTGQYSYASDFGLLFYNSRMYDPSLGRMAQADTIVPGGVQGLDRYAYVNNNPVKYTDPTGHIACDDMDDKGRCINYEQQNRRLYSKLVSDGSFESAPDIKDIPWEGGFGPISHLEGALNKYEHMRRELFISYGFQYVDENGKIDDKAIMALIISSELAAVRGKSIYKEALEALSNQYFSVKSPSGPMQCGGNCSITDQILWTSQMEGIYNRSDFVQNHVTSGAFETYLPDASLAAAGYSVGVDDYSG
jgi:RHS repeat-associated protein